MRHIIYGAGAIGAGIGGLLAAAGHDVILIARGEHLAAIQQRGLTIRRPGGSQVQPVPALGHPREIGFLPDDVVYLTMKTQDTPAALHDLEAAAGLDLSVICAQNGVANERMAARRFARVYAMLVVLPATFAVPGEVALHGEPAPGVLDCGGYPAGRDAAIEGVAADLESAGFSARPDPGAMRLKYGKLLTNLANTVHALCGPRAEGADTFVDRLRAEATACYEAAGIDYAPISEIDARRAESFRARDIEGVQRGSSTWQSFVRRGQRLSVETDYLNGEIVLLGRLHEVPTPANRALQLAASEAVRAGRMPGDAAVADLERREAALRGATVAG